MKTMVLVGGNGYAGSAEGLDDDDSYTYIKCWTVVMRSLVGANVTGLLAESNAPDAWVHRRCVPEVVFGKC